MSTAYDRILDALRANGREVKESGNGRARAQCPAHDDNKPSLSIGPRRDGKGVVFDCRAHCKRLDVLNALALQWRDLFDEPGMRDIYNPTRTYSYPGGRKVRRKPDKTFPQWGEKDDPNLFHADRIGDTETVYVPEGEKDVEAVEAAGGVAVCAPMGAGQKNLNRYDWSVLGGKHAVIVTDKDEAGYTHAARVAKLLRGVAASVRTVEAAEDCKDFADHLAADHTLDELVPVPEPDPIDGAALLADVERFAGRFLAFATTHHLVVVVLWIVHTWAVNAFYVTPRLVLDSPEPGSGKTRVLEVLALLCRNAKLTLSTTTAALYRRIAAAGEAPPTVLQDEADAVFGKTNNPQAEDLRALFNAGYKCGATVDRCEGDAKNMKVREFPVFAPVALAGLAGKMPATITDRAITLHMRRRAPDEHVAEFRERDAAAEAAPLRELIEAWTCAHHDTLTAARPTMPEGVRDRPAEVWEALIIIADAAGGDWPQRARAACRHFVLNAEPDALSFGLRLLRDVRDAFGELDRMFSVDLILALLHDEESEWRDLWGKPLDQRRLAKELKRYGVRSTKVRIGEHTAQGYLVGGDDGLAQAWHRYLPERPCPEQPEHPEHRRSADSANGTQTEQVEHERNKWNTNGTGKTLSEQALLVDVPDVPDVPDTNGSQLGGRHSASQFKPPTGPGRCPECGCHTETQGHSNDCQQRIAVDR
ncbi:DUF3631 domain-containing protein [Mycolicibacterium sp. ND9-15]|uniref:DUF3631 domain-containing protein n=1 Tax=Mycolicibacterium sp. ND9-15 TaxID=3042320 RepID=UPI002DDA5471|nr:DUF3631 domain-containing protein [Mycolicibacterium sp. ND9-15]WSE58442.1 DUF3631 domain-containing protein [Mycolicibacterium sp. ND9-15]